jgi:hypothetical protein
MENVKAFETTEKKDIMDEEKPAEDIPPMKKIE